MAQENIVDGIQAAIEESIVRGIVLSPADKAKIVQAHEKVQELQRRYSRLADSFKDPLNKGNSFPMGVGFMRMTKRSEQRLDSSVRKAGESVVLFKELEMAKKNLDALLEGRGTEADLALRARKKTGSQRTFVRKLLELKKGDAIGSFTVVRVNKDRDGYPATFTITGDGIITGFMDKVDVAKTLFGGSKAIFREMVDEERKSMRDTHAAAEQQTDEEEDRPAFRHRG